MAKSILPLLAVAGGMYLVMRSGGGSIEKGVSNAGKTVDGVLRKITHAVTHGDLLSSPHEFKPVAAGDTLKITGAPEGQYLAVAAYNGEDRSDMVDVHHDAATGTLYVTSLVSGDKLPPLLSHGFDTRTVVGNWPSDGPPTTLALVGDVQPQDG